MLVHEFKFDEERLSKAMKVTPEKVRKYFRDGRRSGPLMEYYCEELFSMMMPENDGKAYDLISEDYEQNITLKYEVRCLTKGVFFCPSSCVGSGRTFSEEKFFNKLDEITHYIICDVSEFPAIKIYKFAKEIISDFYTQGSLGKTTKITYKKFHELFVPTD